MLAYVFWHQRASTCTREEYQTRLSAFHRILQTRQSEGFIGSVVLEMEHVPWMGTESEVYEDWYLVENSAALDPLDEAAVTGICRESHNQVARLASNGTGGLYRLKGGTFDLAQAAEIRFATWFGKPAGMTYATLYNHLRSSEEESQSILWQRQMTMGPALEFCLHSARSVRLSDEIESVQVVAHPVFVPGK